LPERERGVVNAGDSLFVAKTRDGTPRQENEGGDQQDKIAHKVCFSGAGLQRHGVQDSGAIRSCSHVGVP